MREARLSEMSRPGPGLDVLRRLARLRFEIRRFLRFSEAEARGAGLTPQQHQLLLGVAGHTGRGFATVSELAEFLQTRHNAVVTLVQRCERKGLVRKEKGRDDRRVVRVGLSARGERVLAGLARVHVEEVRRIRARLRAMERAPRHRARGGSAE